MKKILAIILFLMCGFVYAKSPQLPDPKLTPGDVNPVSDIKNICTVGYTSGIDRTGNRVRNVPIKLRNKVFKLYNIDPKSDRFEMDHLISLQLGGSNDIKNLWPQSYTTKPYNARKKNVLENKMRSLICQGKLDMITAQKEISSNWIEAYKKYIRK